MRNFSLISLLLFLFITTGCKETVYVQDDIDETTPGTAFPMSIDGNGFFVIRDQEKWELKYTKMGNFYLSLSDNIYYLVDPYGNLVQGWNTDINSNITGSTTDFAFPTESVPLETSRITIITNLDKDMPSNSQILASEWDGTATPPIISTAYEYATTINVYDIEGEAHDITIYYDRISNADWEYIVTCNPGEDLRAGIEGTAAAGLLARGRISFDEGSGTITGLTMSRLTGPDDWTLLTSNDFNPDGYLEFIADFIGGTATLQDIALDIGVRWNGASFMPDAFSTTQYASASVTVSKSSDGHGIEALAGITIDGNGLITGHYISGLDIPLFQVSLARFIAPNRLQSEGNFIYKTTDDSGSATTSIPGTNGNGYIVPGIITDDPTFADELFPQTRIDGQGFFIVRKQNSNNFYYTKSGEFNLNKDGYLTTPEGYIVQGWALDTDGNITGSITDIIKTVFTSQPQPTDSITIITNLDKDMESNSAILSSAWDGTSATPVAPTAYEYWTTVKAYDSLGSTHDITVYFDKISNAEWEYILTCNPAEDLRAGLEGTEGAGLLARGRISFNESSGTITGITMSRLTGYTVASAGNNQAVTCTGATGVFTTTDAGISVNNSDILTNTAPASVTLTYTTATNTWATSSGTIVTSSNTGVSINLGGTAAADITVDLPHAATTNGTMTLTLTRSNDWTVLTAAAFNSEGYFEFTVDFLGGTATTQNISLYIGVKWNGSSFVPDPPATTQYASASTTVYQSANGYDAGVFMSESVDESGIIYSSYSNSVPRNDWQIAIATFPNPGGLGRYEEYYYRETARSGSPVVNIACEDYVNCITVSE